MSIKDVIDSTAKPVTPTRQTSKPSGTPRPAVSHHGASRDRILAFLRITMGLVFLWAFLDKTFGLDYSTTSAQAWIRGGSPTQGFLAHVEVGPLQSAFRDWAGTGWANWLFMLTLLGLGIALTLGIGLRVSAIAGVILLALMWFAEFPIARFDSTGAATSSTNPLIDYHFVFAVVLVTLAACTAGDTWGFGRQWARLDLVRRNSWLR
ncbi:MAG TPA: DoxX family membrane protein [Pseudonocardiaceae bacterium]|nr:DoxX family membrane protein [Pseudonocardiaceae bacterium]